jgi:hypothetical protein
MSDTPRTDAIAHRGYHLDVLVARSIDLCRELERENATLREQLKLAKVENNHNWQFQSIHEETLKENAALQAALDQQANYQRELRADRDRLDWLEVGCSCDLSWVGKEAPPSALTSLRKAIDWAMEEEQS